MGRGTEGDSKLPLFATPPASLLQAKEMTSVATLQDQALWLTQGMVSLPAALPNGHTLGTKTK